MAGKAGRSGGARAGAGRPAGRKTDKLKLTVDVVLGQLAREHALPLAKQDSRAIRRLTETLRTLTRMQRHRDVAANDEPEPAKASAVVRMPTPMSPEEWQRTHAPPPTDTPANPELAKAMEAVAAPRRPKPKAPDDLDQPPRLAPRAVGPFGFPMVGPGPAELDLGRFQAERAQLGRRRWN